MAVVAETRTVYRSTSRGRAFLTKRAACKAEAIAIIKEKYPTERQESDNIGVTYPGWHWTDLPRADVLLRGLTKKLAKPDTEGGDGR